MYCVAVARVQIMKKELITVQRFYSEQAESLRLKLVAGTKGLKRIIREPTVNRPGLALAGFTRYFAFKRIQAFGNAEVFFLKSLSTQECQARYTLLFRHRIPCIIFSRSLHPEPAFLKVAEKANVPVFRCPLITMKLINVATLALEWMFAPRGTVMGSMVDILGVGVIIRGESGIGKSESVLALIERGYSLVSDDATRVTLIDGREVVGTSAEITRSHMEVRGIGLINVAAMFGVKSIRQDKRVDLVVTMKNYQDMEEIDRLGMDQEYFDILGVMIPHITIPVRPGRDLARLVEVAAFQVKLKKSGHNAAKELDERLISAMAKKPPG